MDSQGNTAERPDSQTAGLQEGRTAEMPDAIRRTPCAVRCTKFADWFFRRTGLSLLAAVSPFLFQVPPEYSEARTWLERHAPLEADRLSSLLGMATPAPLAVHVVPNDDRIPGWADGIFANGVLILRGLSMERFPEVFRHELAHAFLSARLERGRAPVWFHEGMASLLAGESREFLPGLLAHLRREPRLSTLAETFPEEGMAIHLAYAKSQAVVTFMRREAGWDGLLAVLSDVRAGRGFETALLYRTGRGSRGWEEAFHTADAERLLIAVVTSSSLLWALFAALLVVAYMRQRRARQEVLRAWEAEEEDDTDDPDVPRV
jgi:hypothetical protein